MQTYNPKLNMKLFPYFQSYHDILPISYIYGLKPFTLCSSHEKNRDKLPLIKPSLEKIKKKQRKGRFQDQED